MKKVHSRMAVAMRPSVLFVCASIMVVGVLWFQLGSLVPGFSQPELAARASSSTPQLIADNPLSLPHKVLQYIPQRFNHHQMLAMRSASALIGAFIAACFYYILASWYTRRVAVLGTALFVTSSWFLHSARLGTDSIVFALLIASIAAVVWVQKSGASNLSVLASACLLVILLYIPGMVWFIGPALIWQMSRVIRLLSKQRVLLILFGGTAAILALVPLAWALYSDTSLIRTYLGIPQSFPAPLEIAKNILRVPQQIFLKGPADPIYNLGMLPWLSWFSTVMFVIGVYAYFFKRRLDRTWMIAFVLGMGMILVGIGGPVHTVLLAPFVYLVVAGGIALMLQQWFTIFPINPVARTLGPTLMTLAVVMTSFYNFNRYFIAWPNAPETKQAFMANKPQPLPPAQ